MKKLFLLFTLAFMTLSCEENQDFIDTKGHGLVFLEGEVKAYFDDKGDTKNYKFKADLAWSAEVSADWVEVDPTSGPAGENKIQIKVDKNKSDEKRTGYVDITLSNDKSYRIELEQMAAGESLDDVTPSVSIPNNEIWYTNGSTTEPTTPSNTDVFGANIVSNTFDAEKECWVIKFDGDVTTIGEDAFYGCSSLTSVTIPDSIVTIGDYAFTYCSSLTSVTIPDSVTTIGECAFWVCSSLTSVTIPDSVTTIGLYAFYDCSSLTSVIIGDSVTTIEHTAFMGCSSLTSITIPDSVTSIGYGVFGYCSSLIEFRGKYASEDGRCLIIDSTLNSFAPAGLTEYTIPDSVTTIADWAFQGCDSLTSITIPNSVTTIGGNPFLRCSGLTEINGKYASEDGRCLIIDGVLNSFAPAGLTEYTIPDGVTTIGDSAFEYCSSLTSIIIPNSVTTIGIYAFYNCWSLLCITIPDSVTKIGGDAFSGCSSLTSVYITDLSAWCKIDFDGYNANPLYYAKNLYLNNELVIDLVIPSDIAEIKPHAFHGYSSLTSITIPDSVTKIGGEAFYDCSSLTSIYCKATTPPTWGSWMFDNNASGRKIYVPMESVEAYKSAEYWRYYADDIVGYNFE